MLLLTLLALLAVELKALADEAAAANDLIVRDTLLGLATLARIPGEERTLVRAGAWLSAGAALLERSSDPGAALLYRASQAIAQKLAITAKGDLPGLVLEETVYALGMERAQHLAARRGLETLTQDLRTLRSERDAMQGAFDKMEDERDALVVERDSLVAQLKVARAGAASELGTSTRLRNELAARAASCTSRVARANTKGMAILSVDCPSCGAVGEDAEPCVDVSDEAGPQLTLSIGDRPAAPPPPPGGA